MFDDKEDGHVTYKVVVNQEEQDSIWPADRENPLGWNNAGKSGTKAECLDYIKEIWTGMRPAPLWRDRGAYLAHGAPWPRPRRRLQRGDSRASSPPAACIRE